MHPTLRSQLEQLYGNVDQAPAELTDLLELVSASYEKADRERLSLEFAAKALEERSRLLIANKARKQAVLDGLPGVLLVFTREGVLVECHGSADRPWLQRPELVGLHVDSVFAGRSEPWTRTIALAFSSKEVQTFDFRLKQDSQDRLYEVRVSASGDRAAAFVRDVTEVRKLREQLLVSDRLASVGTLASGVAHEINNPLTYLMMNIDLVRSEFERLPPAVVAGMDPELGDAIAEARSGAERVREIVQQLRSFSRTDDERITKVDVESVLDSTLRLAANELRHRARIVRDYGSVPRVATDESRLRQVVLNLLVNAAQALPHGEADSHEIGVATRVDEDGNIVIEVRDTGPGIPEELHGVIFDPFFTTKPVGVGTGLGLSICHSIITKLGGELGFRTQQGTGTTFWLKLPPSTADSDNAVAVAPAPAPARGRVLVVDDEDFVGRAIVRMLKGCDVTCVTSGAAAVDVLESESFDVVLCDLMMPQMSGMELYTRIRKTDPDMAERFIFMTGGTFSSRVRRFVSEVPNPLVDKPFDVNALHALINERLDGRGALG